MAALPALDEVRRSLLKRGTAAETQELRLAGRLSCVSKHLRDKNRQRCRKLLDGVPPASLDYNSKEGLMGVWERGVKEVLCALVNGNELWSVDRQLCEFDDVYSPTRGRIRIALTGANDEDLQVLTRCSAVEELTLTDCHITDVGAQKLTAWPGLKEVDLENCSNITDQSVEAIASLSGLSNLGLAGCKQLTDRSLVALANQGTVTSLDISRNRHVSHQGLTALAKLPSLKTMTLKLCNMTEECITALALCASVEHLDLSGTGVDDSGLEVLVAARTTWKSLIFDDCYQLTDDALDKLVSACTDLEELSLHSFPRLASNGLAHLAGCTRLQKLDVSRCPQLCDDTIRGIAACTTLKHVDLSNCTAARDFTPLGALTKLNFLSLTECAITSKCIVLLVECCTNLSQLGLCYTDINDADLEVVAKMPSLWGLRLRGCNSVTDKGIVALAVRKPDLESIDISRCRGVPLLLRKARAFVLGMADETRVDHFVYNGHEEGDY